LFTVYVLYSDSFQKIYIGGSSDLKSRIESHNSLNDKGYTKRYRPWKVVYTEEFNAKAEAMKRERQLKSAKGREFVWNLIKSS